jgi:hypothetical protein
MSAAEWKDILLAPIELRSRLVGEPVEGHPEQLAMSAAEWKDILRSLS